MVKTGLGFKTIFEVFLLHGLEVLKNCGVKTKKVGRPFFTPKRS